MSEPNEELALWEKITAWLFVTVVSYLSETSLGWKNDAKDRFYIFMDYSKGQSKDDGLPENEQKLFKKWFSKKSTEEKISKNIEALYLYVENMSLRSDFDYNQKNALIDMKGNRITQISRTGIVAWTLFNLLKPKPKKKTHKNEFLGEIKERLEITITVQKIREMPSYFDYNSTNKFIVALTSDNYKVIWYQNEGTKLYDIWEEGKEYNIKGTVAKHSSKKYNGKEEKTTRINRVNIVK